MTDTNQTIVTLHDLLNYYDARKFSSTEVQLRTVCQNG